MKAIFFLIKTFLITALAIVLFKELVKISGVTLPVEIFTAEVALTAVVALVTFVIGLSFGLVWGESNAYKRKNTQVGYYDL